MTKDQNRDRLIRNLNEIIVNAHFGPDVTCRNCAHNGKSVLSPEFDRCERTGEYADMTRLYMQNVCNTNFSGFTPKKHWFWSRINLIMK